MSSDASHMLEAALEQMDDIIAGSKAVTEYTNSMFDIGSPGYLGSLQVLQLVEELKMALQFLSNGEEKESLRDQIPEATILYLTEWLERGTVHLRSPVNNETYQERLARLEGDKESLVLQVSVLTDQVEAQGEKIRDLESSLEEHHHKLNSTEEMLQQELLSRTSLETQKLDLIDEVSNLKLKLVGMEKEQRDCEYKQHKAESVVNLISELQEQMCRFQQEINIRILEKNAQEHRPAEYKDKELQQDTNPTLNVSSYGLHCYCGGEKGLLQELKMLKNKVVELEGEKSQYERKLKATKLSISYSLHVCYQSLMTKLSSLKLTVEQMQVEKQHWEEKYRIAQAEIMNLQQQLETKDAEIESLRNQMALRVPTQCDSTEREEVYRRRLKEKHQELQRLKIGMETLLTANEEKDRRIEELTLLLNQYRKMKDGQTSGICEQISSDSSEELNGTGKIRNPVYKVQPQIIRTETPPRGPSPSLVSPSSVEKEVDSRTQQKMLSSSLEDLQSGSLQKHVVGEPVEPVVSPENKTYFENNKYQTLPGKFSRVNQNGDSEKLKSPNFQRIKDGAEESDFSLSKTEKLDDSTPSPSDLSPHSSGVDSGPQSPGSPENKKSPKGIKKFWGKIKRTQSGNLNADDLGPSEFRRGGLRATAGPRLARTTESESNISDYTAPFSQWKTEQVCSWLEEFGLGHYVNLTRQWVKTGHTLLTATPQDMEREMGIKHPLHRKKLQLAIRSFNMKLNEKSAALDHIWVTRWLDDIGLPQYKDQFSEARVDGRMLQYLTVNDLLFLKVTSQLHHLSIKCAIHVLHVNQFNPNCLRRRPGDEHNTTPSEVVQWSNHRVMEWLRSVDLAEYAPNLRGSGVHGGLIILEPRFNSDTMAMLLNIPTQKTLLRRHLTTNFNTLIGLEAQQEKREFMESSTYTSLTTTAKVRPKKLGFSNFGHLRKKKLDDSVDYICPMDRGHPSVNGTPDSYGGVRGLSPIFDKDLDELVQIEVTEGTMKQIGVLSEGISNLTVAEVDLDADSVPLEEDKELAPWCMKETSL
ncbi:liprin-beta-2b isoform X3 [Erpetoichthys calabaricus]|uniref:liprin-beta-2b isoform X3 n=1 Tax=Erpetoichthys calabaricus TaxID=27687 RepID=UPI002233FC1C|nr:liprin-beta-2b isoform X3 [Erpetoichthys calabaricus]